MLTVVSQEELSSITPLHHQLGYVLDQDTADFYEALSNMGLADIFIEKRVTNWAKKYQFRAVVDTLEELFKQRAQRREWEVALNCTLTHNEWALLADRLLKGRSDDLDEKNEEIQALNQSRQRQQDYGFGMTLLAIAFLVSNVFDGKNDPLSAAFPPVQLQTLTPEQIQILRQQTELFLQQNQQIEGADTE